MEASCTACSPCKHFLSTLAGTNTMTVCFTAEVQPQVTHRRCSVNIPCMSGGGCPAVVLRKLMSQTTSRKPTGTVQRYEDHWVQISGQFLLGLAPRI